MDNSIDIEITLQDTEIYRWGHLYTIPAISKANLYFGTCHVLLTQGNITFGFMMFGECH